MGSDEVEYSKFGHDQRIKYLVRVNNINSDAWKFGHPVFISLLAVPLKVPVFKHLRIIKRYSGNGANQLSFDGIRRIFPRCPNSDIVLEIRTLMFVLFET